MKKNIKFVTQIKSNLKSISTEAKAKSARRYFPNGIHCIGANASDIKLTINNFHIANDNLTPTEVLSVTESLLKASEFSEEIMVAYGLINKYVKNNYDDNLLFRFEYWLENYATNWALVDDLCIKTIYKYFMARPHLIEKTQHWAYSENPWCRRASNVVWVKFIKRKIGKYDYLLDKKLIFKNCDLLLSDNNEFVQKSIGWLLKAASLHHEVAVIEYIKSHYDNMERSTIRYALEKIDSNLRNEILSIKR